MNVEKTNLLQNSLSFLLSLQIDFPFKLPTLHPTQSFISISFQEQNSNFCKKRRWRSENICDDGGEQQRDKVATSLTLKVCCKRRGGEEGWEILDLLYPPSHYRISLSTQLKHFL